MAELTFVDSNILVYAYNASEPAKQAVAADLLDELWETGTGAVSTQVLQEFYVTATRKWRPPIHRREARQLVAAYGQWSLQEVDLPLIVAASALEEEHTLSFWDALVVVAARRLGATRLVTEDLQSGRRFGGLEIHNPFESGGRRNPRT